MLRSIGYKTIPLQEGIPFDKRLGIIPNQSGRVIKEVGSSEIISGTKFLNIFVFMFPECMWCDNDIRFYCRYICQASPSSMSELGETSLPGFALLWFRYFWWLGLYCSGWVKHGPVGVIATTMNEAFATAEKIVQDLKSSDCPNLYICQNLWCFKIFATVICYVHIAWVTLILVCFYIKFFKYIAWKLPKVS